jgi:hypothetical protein
MMMGTRTEEDRKPECSMVEVGRPGELDCAIGGRRSRDARFEWSLTADAVAQLQPILLKLIN